MGVATGKHEIGQLFGDVVGTLQSILHDCATFNWVMTDTDTTFEKLTLNTITNPRRLRSIVRKVRTDGSPLVDQEIEEGVRSIAAPIHNSRGEVVAAMNVSCHATRVDVDRMLEEFKLGSWKPPRR